MLLEHQPAHVSEEELASRRVAAVNGLFQARVELYLRLCSCCVDQRPCRRTYDEPKEIWQF